MKIGILTHYNVSSHGALLQMYALKKTLAEQGHDVVILTYSRNMDFIGAEQRKRFSASISNIPYYISKYMGEDGFGSIIYQYNKQKKLRHFRNANFSFVPYTDSAGLDCVIVGADEVFALENGLNFMMFGHGIRSRKIIAYAPSCGQTDPDRINGFGVRELITSGLGRFSALSARDMGTSAVIKDLTGKEVPIVCDPALLYPFKHPEKANNGKNYMVIYSYQSNFKDKERINKIIAYARERGLELWSVGVYYKWCDKHINCDPIEMLDIFAKAEAVITDTFHGTISSYIAHTPMAVFVRDNNNVKLEHLLNTIGIADRKVSNPDMLDTILSGDIDFDLIDRTVDKVREKSMNYLLEALG